MHFGLAAVAGIAWKAIFAYLGAAEENAKVGVEVSEELTWPLSVSGYKDRLSH